MDPAIPYVACVVGAASLYLLLKPGTRAMKSAGIVLGLGAFGWVVLEAAKFVQATTGSASETLRPEPVFVIFSLIAVASAVRMITHPRPVYCALYFIMVVLSSAGLFLLLQAEFMAFALIIVYAGAILITYMFVLMLAQQAPNADQAPISQPEYDRIPREPGMAACIGFLMLALFTHMIFTGSGQVLPDRSVAQAVDDQWRKLNVMPGKIEDAVRAISPGAIVAPGATVQWRDDQPSIEILKAGESQPTIVTLPNDALPNNLDLVGLDLVSAFPVSLELAGVILLLAMFGAVVLARKQIELGEDDVREAAGMRRLGLHADDSTHGGDR